MAREARLLWRGSLAISPEEQLHGLAIVARSFHVAAMARDDPFSSSCKHDTLIQELCLDLEMLRHRTLMCKNTRARLCNSARNANDASITHPLPKVPKHSKVHGRKALKKSIEMLR